jgi:FHS family L-fucose permease-like MFS transporter
MENGKTNYGALTTLTTVFFFWGFIAAGNSVFIPFCKHFFHLDQFQSQLIDFAFYGAYYLGALGLFVASNRSSKDIVLSWGYKKSIVYGLLFSAFGAAAMIVSVYLNVFAGMLFGLFIVALGFSLQQTSANPFMIALGDEKTGSNRINLGGGINSLGTTIGPVLVALALFGTASTISDDMISKLSLSKVVILYAGVGCLFLGIAALFGFSKKVPAGKLESQDNKQETASKAMVTMLIITGLLIACFAPVFSSYTSKEAKAIVKLEKSIETDTKQINKINDSIGNIIHADNYQKSNNNLKIKAFETEINKIKASIEPVTKEILRLKKPLENSRMLWLTFALLVVIIGIFSANLLAIKKPDGWGAMKYPQLSLGMIAIFVYVGVEVAVGSNLGELLKQKEFGRYSSSQITPFISMYWGSLMIGRWSGAINAFALTKATKNLMKFILPLIAFGIILGISVLAGYNVAPLKWYILCVAVQLIAFLIADDKPALSLSVFGFLGLTALVIGLLTSGMIAVYAFLSAGLFCSIMWPCIFSLSLTGLGKYQAQGSGFLVMMILGGALIPPLQGKLSDIIGIQPSFIVGALCFAYILFFAIFVNRLLKKQGVSLD